MTGKPKRKSYFKPVFISLALFLSLFLSLGGANSQCAWTDVEKVVAVGDLHGDFKNFVKILKGTGIVDNDLHWTGGKTHLVQTGDIMDRGPDARKIFDLLMRLEKEANTAGGAVHVLIGNHEEMNISGIVFDYPGYVPPEQFVAFLPNDQRIRLDRKFRMQRTDKFSPGGIPDISSNKEYRQFWRDVMANDKGARDKYINHFNATYGKWVMEQNAVIKINDTIFVHGGISEEYSTRKLEDINNALREELKKASRKEVFEQKILFARDGPLWYRDLAVNDGEVFRGEVERILANLQAQHMIIAHTPHFINPGGELSENDMKREGGKIWIVDTGISEVYRDSGGKLSALIINNGEFSVWGAKDEK